MKKWILIGGLSVAFFLQYCTTDFDLNADFKETPVIYSLLSQNDSVHYIRINRAFLNDELDAVTLAQDPNSIYYGDELYVVIKVFNGSFIEIDSIPVERVDGDTLGFEKNPDGIFASLPNILYRFKATLNQGNYYQIFVKNIETGIIAKATTPIIDTFKIKRPDDESIFPFAPTFSTFSPFQFRWISAQDAKFYDLTMRLHYRERTYFPEGDSFVTLDNKYIDWVFKDFYEAESVNGGLTLNFDIEGSTFYNFIKGSFDPISDFTFLRFADSVQFFVDAGGEALWDYYQYNNSTLGLTEGQITDTYTNVEGGLGVFSTRYHKEGKIYPLSGQTVDSIACSSFTEGLNFATDNSNANFPYCE